jgi:hypothetical protein
MTIATRESGDVTIVDLRDGLLSVQKAPHYVVKVASYYMMEKTSFF